MDTTETIPTWGYKPDGSAQIFDLARGADLPEGWSGSPSVITDPSLATADALTMRATGHTFAHPVEDAPSPAAVDPDALANALAEIDRLTAIIARGTEENERLVAELETADALHDSGARVMDELKADLDAARAEVATLTARLTEAQADGGFSAAERDELTATVARLTADLAQARADLDAATAPAPATKRR